MKYTVSHATRFEYPYPVRESAMEVRLGPRSDSSQEVQAFELETHPAARVFRYDDAFGNAVHHFDVPAPHQELLIRTRMQVSTSPARPLPDRLEPSAWETLARLRADGQLWDFFEPSPRAPESAALRAFADVCGVARASDPLTALRQIVAAVHRALVYAPDTTTVDTAVDAVLETRSGVCQDFAHVTLALARAQAIPCRYVSGYLAPTDDPHADQILTSHAWIEAWLPGLEWTALDPTHDVPAGERHISVAVGRDYDDAAPTRGVFSGGSAGALSVSVRIERGSEPVATGATIFRPASSVTREALSAAQSQQQQQ